MPRQPLHEQTKDKNKPMLSSPATSSVIEDAIEMIQVRLAEIEVEKARLERVISDLGATVKPTTTGPRRSGGTKSRRAAIVGTSGKKRRTRDGGTRAQHALNYLLESPGMSAPAIAIKLGIKPNYVYRVMTELKLDRLVEKRGTLFYPSASAKAAASTAAPEAAAAPTSNE